MKISDSNTNEIDEKHMDKVFSGEYNVAICGVTGKAAIDEPTQVFMDNKDPEAVGTIRNDPSFDNGIAFFSVAGRIENDVVKLQYPTQVFM